MLFRRPLTRMPTAVIGLLLLALWLGWVSAGFAALGRRPPTDQAALAQLQAQLQQAHPQGAEAQARAVLLNHCRCQQQANEPAWQRLQAAMQQGKGQALRSDLPAPFEVLLLDAAGTAVYAGPLQPTLAACGQLSAEVANWLPALLDGSQPPLFLPSPCPC